MRLAGKEIRKTVALCFFALWMFLQPICAWAEAADKVVFSFPGVFLNEGEAIYITDTEYRSQNMSLKINAYYSEEYQSDITEAEIYIRSLDCMLRVFGGGKWKHTSMKIPNFAKHSGAVAVLSGDTSAALNAGLVVGNGVVCRKKGNNKRDVGILWNTGEFRCYTPKEANEIDLYQRLDEVWHAFVFGPSLLTSDGQPIVEKKDFSTKEVFGKNPRAAIGSDRPGHYFWVTADGRKTASKYEKNKRSKGITLPELSQIMYKLGCTSAYNLDGGQSAGMWYGGKMVNVQYNNGRKLGDVIVLIEPADEK